MKKILKVIEWVVFGGLIFLAFIVVSPALPIDGLPKTFIVSTGSMEPKIKSGSLIFSVPTLTEKLSEGEIIVFQSPQDSTRTITHRIEKINPEANVFITKGDNNNAVDDWQIEPEDIKGKYIFGLSYLGRAAEFVRQPKGFILLIVLPALFIIARQFFNIINYIKNTENEGVKTPLLVVFLSLSSVLILPTAVYAVYKDTVTVNGLKLSTKDWVLPESEITGLYGSGELTEITNLSNFRVDYQAKDVGSGIDYVELWYSHNQNDWQIYDSDSSGTSGSFQFDPPNGDGFYDFQVLAFDKSGNQEDKDFENNFKTVFVDTNPPVSNLSEDYILSADDGFGSGVLRIFYSVNGGGEKIVWGNQVSISDDLPAGGNTIIFYAEDTAGNIEEKNTLTL
jgi:signal peptidase I